MARFASSDCLSSSPHRLWRVSGLAMLPIFLALLGLVPAGVSASDLAPLGDAHA